MFVFFFYYAIHDWYGMCYLVELNVNLDRSNFNLIVHCVGTVHLLILAGEPPPATSTLLITSTCSWDLFPARATRNSAVQKLVFFLNEKSRWRFGHNVTDLHIYKNIYFYKCYGCFGRPGA